MSESEYFVHSTSVVDQPCEIGAATKIWHFCHIMEGAKIGSHCILGQNVFVGGKAVIGNRVKIQNNVSVYDGVVMEEDVFCGPAVVFTNEIYSRSFTEKNSEFKKTIVRKGATLGANATLRCGIVIGRYAFIGAGAVVTKDVSDYALIVGVPGWRIGWVCECGVTIKFQNDQAQCSHCQKQYHLEGEEKIVKQETPVAKKD